MTGAEFGAPTLLGLASNLSAERRVSPGLVSGQAMT